MVVEVNRRERPFLHKDIKKKKIMSENGGKEGVLLVEGILGIY